MTFSSEQYMKKHNINFLNEISEMSVLLLFAVMLFMSLLVSIRIFAMLNGAILSTNQISDFIIQAVIGAVCYLAISFLTNSKN